MDECCGDVLVAVSFCAVVVALTVAVIDSATGFAEGFSADTAASGVTTGDDESALECTINFAAGDASTVVVVAAEIGFTLLIAALSAEAAEDSFTIDATGEDIVDAVESS